MAYFSDDIEGARAAFKRALEIEPEVRFICLSVCRFKSTTLVNFSGRREIPASTRNKLFVQTQIYLHCSNHGY